jgi:hypothetical protein
MLADGIVQPICLRAAILVHLEWTFASGLDLAIEYARGPTGVAMYARRLHKVSDASGRIR